MNTAIQNALHLFHVKNTKRCSHSDPPPSTYVGRKIRGSGYLVV